MTNKQRKRRRTTRYTQLAEAVDYLEIRPNDPDIDELIAAAKEVTASCESDGSPWVHPVKLSRLRKSLEPKQ